MSNRWTLWLVIISLCFLLCRQKDKKFGVKTNSYAKVNKEAEDKKAKLEAEKEQRKQVC